MPDRYGNPDTDRDDPAAARARAQGARDRELEQRHAELELAAQARAACALCDPDGYRTGGTVCDHTDHAPSARRGIEACRTAIAQRPRSLTNTHSLDKDHRGADSSPGESQ